MSADITGKYGEAYVLIGLQKVFSDVRIVPGNIIHQLEWGDMVIAANRTIGIKTRRIEVKTEKTNPNGNLFFERWSNKKTGRGGWLMTSKADELYYLFWDEGYGFRFSEWQRSAWLIQYLSEARKYPLIEQKKYAQDNDTWGYLVPTKDLDREALGDREPIRFHLDEQQRMEAIKLTERGKIR